MTQTIGYYCDECRRKYVRHACKRGIVPCGHLFQAAVRVYAKAYGRGWEAVAIGNLEFGLFPKPHVPELVIIPGGRFFWDHVARFDDGTEMPLGRLLKQKGAKFARAFEARWDSCVHPPDWVGVLSLEPKTLDEWEKETKAHDGDSQQQRTVGDRGSDGPLALRRPGE